MSGQAAAAPITAILTQVLNPIFGWTAMFQIIAGEWMSQMNTYIFT